MDIICNACQSKFTIPDHKIPRSKTVFLKCPKCNNRISLKTEHETDDTNQNNTGMSNNFENFENQDYTHDDGGTPLDFIEEEGKTALICEHDQIVIKKLKKALDLMEYNITTANDAREALIQLRNRTFDLVLLNENFDTDNPDENGVLAYFDRLEMPVRRDMFIALISRRFRTMDNMMAFNKSVNIIINPVHINDIIKILPKTVTENEIFFEIYNDTLKENRLI